LLIGGEGADFLWGGYDDDILIAGTTDYDSFREDLEAIRDDWTNPAGRQYDARVHDFIYGNVSGRPMRPGEARMDAEVDHLFGDSGKDVFYYTWKRDVLGRLDSGEQAHGEWF
jgi:hypothetical protein